MERDIETLVRNKTQELFQRSQTDAWAACCSIWVRLLVSARPGWMKWPELRDVALEALNLALRRSLDMEMPPHERLVLKLEGFSVDDDGSDEWQQTVDLIGMLLAALDDQDVNVCLTLTLTTYLEGVFHQLANRLALAVGGPISDLEARTRLAGDADWLRTVRFVEAL